MLFAGSIPAELLPTKSIVICSTGRSGSNLLGLTLGTIGYTGKSREFFCPDVLAANGVGSQASDLHPYLAQVYAQGKTPNQVFGVKLHWDHMINLLKIVRTDPDWQARSDIEILSALFPNPRFIFIRRQNLVKQAISMEIGKQTGVYIVPQQDADRQSPRGEQKLSFKPLNIYRYKQGLKGRNQKWRSFFQQNHLPFLEVVYENLVNDFDNIMQQVIEFSGVELPTTGVKITKATKKQGSQLNERWLRYYKFIPEGPLGYYSEIRSYVRKALVSS
ncbi:sulfotransferase [Leptolyngbya cf. ectocarpi LEGE 11479]|uniref:Sulfotransferase n=1 Tax=Leptolyngbya cf. ectocarpi LEGE 11479 TaxID=1828722 RepID=A0A929FC77_LEPEC|nr:Stf0 family sulfotransferase [Leptolyngbya ectocarpi]MBE9069293.1 sulfotransferase [Leptolyngbya cf. ectocarpi LEGE 11479]